MVPTRPSPTIPRVLPCSSTPWNRSRSHLPERRAASARGTFRAEARMSASVCSAADRMFDWGAFTTITPRRVAASTSTLSRPIPALAITFRFEPASMTLASTFVWDRTTSASKEGIASASPSELQASWTMATSDPDPMNALGATLGLARGLDQLQSALVAEAIRAGSTWEQVGETLGISRQAAWARFRDAVDQEGGRRVQEENARLKERIHEQVRSLRDSIRAMEDEHRRSRTEAMDRIREVDRRFRQQRQELKDRMKASIRSLQDELRSRKRPG